MLRDAVPNSFRLLLEMDLTGDIVSPVFTTPRVVLAKDTGRNRAGAFERVIQRQSLLTPRTCSAAIRFKPTFPLGAPEATSKIQSVIKISLPKGFSKPLLGPPT